MVNPGSQRLGKYLTLGDFCTCSRTYQRFADQIDPWPQQPATIAALQALNREILDPLIDHVGRSAFVLTYGFCSPDLKRFLARRDPESGEKYGRVDPRRDQHMAHELNRTGQPYCDRLGSACDAYVRNVSSDRLLAWIVTQGLPFDSIYHYGPDRPLHISHGPQHKRLIWTFTPEGTPRPHRLPSSLPDAPLT